jgi:predicted ATPase
MRIKSAHIENFKGIKDLHIDLEDYTGHGRDLTCILGDNGSGKTSALQAIALPLAMATRRARYPDQFDWYGFLPERVSSLGPTHVELVIDFSDDEIRNNQELYKSWYDSLTSEFRESHQITPPSTEKQLSLTYEQNRLTTSEGIPGIHQFLGRYYVKALAKSNPRLRDYYSTLGDIFWFDQYRNLGSDSVRKYLDDDKSHLQAETWQSGVEKLREFLIVMWSYHISGNKSFGKNYIPALESRFQKVFPDRRFLQTAPKNSEGSTGVNDTYFLLQCGDRVYDLAEMSSGEQAIFPLMYEFVRLDIGNSVVLIDELELHLHATEQQRLLNALPSLGTNNQFIITTHSQHVADAIPNDHEVRLEGGVLCL